VGLKEWHDGGERKEWTGGRQSMTASGLRLHMTIQRVYVGKNRGDEGGEDGFNDWWHRDGRT